MTLVLSTVDAVERYLGVPLGRNADLQALDETELTEALDSAREEITAMVIDFPTPGDPTTLPTSLHRACKMRAAQLYARQSSRFGVEAYSLGGEAGNVLTSDPDIRRLMLQYRKAVVGASSDS